MIEVDIDGVAIIVGYPTGVVYYNQADGTCCHHPRLEGFAVPFRLGLAGWEDEICNYFSGEPHWGSGGRLTEADADFLDKYLCVYHVDRTRLKDSMEAWVYVVPTSGCGWSYGLIEGPVVFCWPNSD